MKKIFTFAAALTLCVGMNAENLNNPTDPNSNNRYIVLWDCDADDFADSNDFEPGQTVTLAFDLGGTVWETELQGTAPAGETLTPAIHMWFNMEKAGKSAVNRNPGTERLRRIRDNIYGATINLAQEFDANTPGNGAAAIASGEILYCWAQIFMASYLNADGTAGTVWNYDGNHFVDFGSADCVFTTKPATGVSDAAFTGASYTPAMFIIDEPGYAAPCGTLATDIREHKMEASAPKFIKNGHLYFNANGMRYNAMGATIAK
ncbi:MAG: hypothetical protein MJZ75_03105 [Paludibacteraceae bacterium]|nr:hypothetical protein [Paludibacteraceae bacterium]